MEGFSNVNDDFNDVLLFGLMGNFLLIFTDYIYKLGKKHINLSIIFKKNVYKYYKVWQKNDNSITCLAS